MNMQQDDLSPQLSLEEKVDYNHLEAATFGQRSAAYILDSILTLAVCQALSPFLAVKGNTFYQLMFPLFVSTLYYILFQKILLGTPGKLLLGLRVVSTAAGRDGQLTYLQLVGRETIGRFICNLVFGLGYMAIKNNLDRAGWHDKMYNTKVVSLKPVEEIAGKQIFAVFGGIVLLIALTLGATYYTLLFTAEPLRWLANDLRARGIEVEGIRGSFKRGIEIDRIFKEEAEYSYEFKNVTIEATLLKEVKDLEWVLRFDRLMAESGVIKIKTNFSGASASKVATKPPVSTPIPDPTSGLMENPLPTTSSMSELQAQTLAQKKDRVGLAIGLMDLNNIRIVTPWLRTETKIERFHIKEFFLSSMGLHLERLFFDSSQLTADFTNVDWALGRLAMEKPITMRLKKDFYPEVLRADLVFNLKMSGALSPRFYENFELPENIDLNIGNRLFLQKTALELNLALQNFDVRSYLNLALPIHRIDMNFRASGFQNGRTPFPPKVAGNLWIGPHNFQIQPPLSLSEVVEDGLQATTIMGQRDFFSVRIIPSFLTAHGPQSKSFTFLLKGLPGNSNEENLALLLFGKGMLSLPPDYRSYILNQASYFSPPAHWGPIEARENVRKSQFGINRAPAQSKSQNPFAMPIKSK